MACSGRSPEVGAADLDIAARPPDRFLAGNTATHGAGYYPHFSHFGFLLAYASERDAYDYARHLIPFLALNGSEVAF
jgi:hypothetical protein